MIAANRSAAAPAVNADGDDGETIEPGSLLAGPRNVQPYIVKRGEQYMSKQQLEHFRFILNSWKRDLMVEVDRTVTHMKDEAANFPDPNDRATQEEEFSLELRTRDRERKLIRKIDDALKRIEDGSYGYCLETGEEIGIKRLEARPVATLSIEAQERRERRERQYGDATTAIASARELERAPIRRQPRLCRALRTLPTGSLHLGSLVAAVGSFVDARSCGGRWLLRMEDLDAARVIPGCADEMLHTLEALACTGTAPSSTRAPAQNTTRARNSSHRSRPHFPVQLLAPRAHPEGGYPGRAATAPGAADPPPRASGSRPRRSFEDRARGSALPVGERGDVIIRAGTARSPTSWRWW